MDAVLGQVRLLAGRTRGFGERPGEGRRGGGGSKPRNGGVGWKGTENSKLGGLFRIPILEHVLGRTGVPRAPAHPRDQRRIPAASSPVKSHSPSPPFLRLSVSVWERVRPIAWPPVRAQTP